MQQVTGTDSLALRMPHKNVRVNMEVVKCMKWDFFFFGDILTAQIAFHLVAGIRARLSKKAGPAT